MNAEPPANASGFLPVGCLRKTVRDLCVDHRAAIQPNDLIAALIRYRDVVLDVVAAKQDDAQLGRYCIAILAPAIASSSNK
jgi:hypothetical protein